MTIDDWRARYDGLNAEVDRLRAEVERLQADIMNVHLKRAMLVVQRDAAQAGEARAVEVIQKLLKSAVPNRRDHPTMWDAWAFAERFLKEDSPALGWLAQQRAEAAAEENDRWADDWWAWDGDCTASDFTARAAALRAGEVGND